MELLLIGLGGLGLGFGLGMFAGIVIAVRATDALWATLLRYGARHSPRSLSEINLSLPERFNRHEVATPPTPMPPVKSESPW